MSNTTSPLQHYLSAPIGAQMQAHLDRRAAIRRDVPLLPRRWAELLTAWRHATAPRSAPATAARRPAGQRLASQTK
ncbi:hypothetical protein ACL598_24190 [Bordetella bronchialis]|uniref:hypothetical protein n=1 Tax=Bordetella bronchialis TaxID=463025 RepID=UPI003CFBF83B